MLVLIAFITGCNKSKTVDDSNQVPQETAEKIFKSSNPNAMDVIWEQEGEFMEAEFTENGIEKSILYDVDGNVVETETAINTGQLPESIPVYINENYPGAEIEEAEKLENSEGTFFVVAIESENDEEMELLFGESGSFIEELIEMDDEGAGGDDDEGDEDGGEENEVVIDVADLPDAVLEYVGQNYSDFTITEAEMETKQDGVFYEVELTGPDGEEVDLIFDQNWNFIGIED